MVKATIPFGLNDESAVKSDPEREVKDLHATVTRLMNLPQEIPTVATVSDKTKLEGQPFFQKAENGDKVLIYQQAQKAVLYRPSIKKIIDVVPVRALNQEASPAGRVGNKADEPVRVAVYNGTAIFGLTFKIEGMITTRFANAAVVSNQTASWTDYPETLVVDLGGGHQGFTQELALFLGGKVAELPEGEKLPTDADLLVIVWANQI